MVQDKDVQDLKNSAAKTGIRGELEKNQIVVINVSGQEYQDKVVDISKTLVKDGKVIYVSVNKPYSSLKGLFEKEKVSPENFFFVDVVTENAGLPKEGENVKFVSAPTALTELSIVISELAKNKEFYCLFFDSTLTVYNDSLIVTKFVHNLTSKLRTLGTKAVFVIMKGERETALEQDINMFVDDVLEYEACRTI